ncbi:alpha/beta hydrolase [Bacillus suaedae]|uniref:Alpha/beta hydrolase n=1 Tax=Halalkalibacter suaedae TaxID=2822140 RepID=A0A941ATR4_9BACI|nr:alpha/beta hydrolase-fold protein [Bacillus suaedae]MBP3952499.1 alpha/beta hydrolase [Bacillus suaedae]
MNQIIIDTENSKLLLEQFKLAGTSQFNMVSKKDIEYRVFISVPTIEPPSEGFPVIYLLDGNAVFGTVVEAIRIQSRKPEKTGISPAIIVGIGYPVDEPFFEQRFFDYTLGPAEIDILLKNEQTSIPAHGGAKQFLDFIEQELKPIIKQNYPINLNKQTLFGHSLGGLFVLYTMFSRSSSFQTYISGSPSLHWNKTLLLEVEKSFVISVQQQKIDQELLIGVGELERWKNQEMGVYSKELVNRLNEFQNDGLHVKYLTFPGEGHVSVLLPLINELLRFSLKV